ncbi:MAG: hypothetical protein IPN42_00895 [Methylococcaceae bacterium]|nr:hypothetical protein [Methylococcaceae bacterium]
MPLSKHHEALEELDGIDQLIDWKAIGADGGHPCQARRGGVAAVDVSRPCCYKAGIA